jgi:predicted transcriptional regulator
LAREKQTKRSKFETMYTILRLCTQTTKKTHIMYKANLSHQQLEKYLSAVTQADLLILADGGYLTTTKGRFFVDKFRELADVVEDGKISGANVYSHFEGHHLPLTH